MMDLENEVRKILRKKTWLVLSTVDEYEQSHSSVVVYQSDGHFLYISTSKDTLKVKNIQRNNKVSITIPFRKNFFHKLIPAPPAELHFIGKAELVPRDDEYARKIFAKFLKYDQEADFSENSIWIKIIPSNIISTYGVGVSLLTMRKPEKARNLIHFSSIVPAIDED